MEEKKYITIMAEQQNKELFQNACIVIYAVNKESEFVNAVSSQLSIDCKDIFHAVSGKSGIVPSLMGQFEVTT